MVERIVASRDMLAGTRLEADDLAVRSFPSRWVGTDALAPEQYPDIQGKVLTADVQAGNPLLAVHVLPGKRAFSDQLAPGRRAVTLPVDQVNSLSGLLRPGDLIDLYVSFDHQRKRLTTPLLQGVQVLATGRHTQDIDDAVEQSYGTVTLDAAPEDVIKLVAAQQAGALTAILRHPTDARADRLAARGDLATLLGVANPPVKAQRRAVILYGSSGARGLPAWARQDSTPSRPRNGWFDMPEEGMRLSSAWRDGEGDGIHAATSFWSQVGEAAEAPSEEVTWFDTALEYPE